MPHARAASPRRRIVANLAAQAEPAAARTRPHKDAPMPSSDQDTLDALKQELAATRPPPRRSRRDGRGAETPMAIPPHGWFAVAKRVAIQFSSHRVMEESASVTFYTLLALFPALAALVSLYGLFADPAALSDELHNIPSVLPGGAMDILDNQLHSLASSSSSALSLSLAFSLATSLWSSNQSIKSLFSSLNIVYGAQETRGFVRFTLVTLSFTLGALLFVILAIACVVALPIVLNFVGVGQWSDILLRLARWPLLLVVIGAFLAMVYRYGPCRPRVGWRWVTPGSAFAAVTWAVASLAFSYYVSHFGSYNKTYGSLGAAIGFMTWIWISTMVVLIGAELDAEIEQQAEQGDAAPTDKGVQGVPA
jgi:membrane protein